MLFFFSIYVKVCTSDLCWWKRWDEKLKGHKMFRVEFEVNAILAQHRSEKRRTTPAGRKAAASGAAGSAAAAGLRSEVNNSLL